MDDTSSARAGSRIFLIHGVTNQNRSRHSDSFGDWLRDPAAGAWEGEQHRRIRRQLQRVASDDDRTRPSVWSGRASESARIRVATANESTRGRWGEERGSVVGRSGGTVCRVARILSSTFSGKGQRRQRRCFTSGHEGGGRRGPRIGTRSSERWRGCGAAVTVEPGTKKWSGEERRVVGVTCAAAV